MKTLPLLVALALITLAIPKFVVGSTANTVPVVKVSTPKTGTSGQSPVHFYATASSPACPKGIAAIRIYTAPGVNAYNVKSNTLDTSLALAPGTYDTVVQAWDNCGGVGKTPVTITVASQTGDKGHYLYVLEGNGISGWGINPTSGAVSPTGQGVVPAHADPFRGAADKAGTHLFVANVTSSDVSAYNIDRTNGYLTQAPGSPYHIGRIPTAVAVHPAGKFVYVTRDNDAAGDGVAGFSVKSDGSLTPVPGSPFNTQINPQSLLVDSTGKYLYVVDSSYDGYIDAFTIDQLTGALTPLAGSPYAITPAAGCAGTFASDITEDVVNRRLYTSDMFDNAISGYNMAKGVGTLSQVPGSAFPNYPCIDPMVAFNPDTLTVLPNGKFLYAANGLAQTISTYSVNGATGSLSFVNETAQCAYGVTTGPILRADSSGKFLYTIGVSGTNCTGNKAIVGLKVDPTTGKLTPIKGSPAVDLNPTGAISGAIVVVP